MLALSCAIVHVALARGRYRAPTHRFSGTFFGGVQADAYVADNFARLLGLGSREVPAQEIDRLGVQLTDA